MHHREHTWPALYHWLATHVGCSDSIDVMRFRAWPALSYENRAALSPEIAQRLFQPPLHASVSRIESFATCPFKHFATYGLGLRERADEDVTALDLGNVYHSILERLVGQMLKGRADWSDVTDARIKTYAKEVGQQLRGELMLSSARNQYLLRRVERTLEQVVSAQHACGKRGGFRPKWVELEFGRGGDDGLPALQMTTPGGHEVHLHGKIDRVDLLEEQAAFAVIDYKLRGNMLSLDQVYHGISLQLITYLLVLQANGERLTGRRLTPAAAFYVKLLRQLEDVKHPDDATKPDDPAFDLKVKPRGVLDLAYLGTIDEQCVRSSDVVNVRLKNDGTLGWKGTSDAAESAEFAALMKHVAWRIGQLADEIVAGRIDVSPFRLNDLTPCPRCEFRSVCRFELPVNTYHHLTVLGREQVLAQVTQGAAHGA